MEHRRESIVSDVAYAWVFATIFAALAAGILLSSGFKNDEGTGLMVSLAGFAGLTIGSAIFLA